MDTKLKGKVALVTGAGSPVGFGRGIAETLAKDGCDIIANDINLDDAEKTAAAIKAMGRQAMAIKADITKKDEVAAMVEKALAKFGKIDILVNNAGGAYQPRPFVETPESVWEKAISLNFYGTLNCIKAVLPSMIEKKSGKIVNIVSGAGLKGNPNFSLYGASKAAVIVFTKGVALELIPHGIYMNCIAPGIGDTRFLSSANFPQGELERTLNYVPTKKSTTPQDIGNMAAYLSSELSDNIIGQTFSVDGGLTL